MIKEVCYDSVYGRSNSKESSSSSRNEETGRRMLIIDSSHSSFSETHDLQVNTARSGPKPYMDFFKTQSNITRSVEKGNHKKQAPSAFLAKLNQKKIIPQPLGVSTLSGLNEELKIGGFQIGDEYGDCLGKALKF